jgi:hypothetical protein
MPIFPFEVAKNVWREDRTKGRPIANPAARLVQWATDKMKCRERTGDDSPLPAAVVCRGAENVRIDRRVRLSAPRGIKPR